MGNLLKGLGVFIIFSGVAVAEDFKNWPLKGTSENAETAQAAFKEQCEKWAAGKAGDDKVKFVDNCVKRMTKVWPLGYAESDGG